VRAAWSERAAAASEARPWVIPNYRRPERTVIVAPPAIGGASQVHAGEIEFAESWIVDRGAGGTSP